MGIGTSGNEKAVKGIDEQKTGAGQDNTKTRTTRRSTSTSTVSGKGTDTNGTGTETEKKLDEMVVGVEVQKTESKPKQTVDRKPRKPVKTKKQIEQEQVIKNNIEQFSKMIEVGFSIASVRAGEHWRLSESESKQLAIPIANILEKNSLSEKVSEYGDYTMLAVTTIMIFAPRIMMQMELAKGKEVENDGNKTGEIKAGNTEHVKEVRTTVDDKVSGRDILSAGIPPVG